ncbi:hypothetical protein WJX81_008138 [Elliptochloris bilobata]|uniref:Uncharacterized protein n=1 Tax=Elliptochloris bilobata TaxID=381761 RepID=A0AAW1S8L7_9CHLO
MLQLQKLPSRPSCIMGATKQLSLGSSTTMAVRTRVRAIRVENVEGNQLSPLVDENLGCLNGEALSKSGPYKMPMDLSMYGKPEDMALVAKRLALTAAEAPQQVDSGVAKEREALQQAMAAGHLKLEAGSRL